MKTFYFNNRMHSNRALLFIFFFVTLFLTETFAQDQVIRKSSRLESMNHFLDASDGFQAVHQNGDREASLMAARNLYKARRYDEALVYYQRADSLQIMTDHESVFAYFECLKSVMKYEEADALVKARISDFADRPEFGIHKDLVPFYNKISSYSGSEPQLLPVNSAFSDISPTLYNGWLYFVSTRPATGNHAIHRINMQPFYNLYTAPADGMKSEAIRPSGDFGKPEKTIRYGSTSGVSLPAGINRENHDGPVYVSPSGNWLFFTSNWSETKRPKKHPNGINLMLYYAKKEGDTWSKPVAFPTNSFEYSNQHGYFDEKTSTLYFASNRPGGKGGYDIWKSVMGTDGNWSACENLGSAVNSTKSEVFPSLAPDGSLIFASNGWPGLGGLDLFLQPSVSGNAQPPLNLLKGINSEKDDFGLVVREDGQGYLVSNRPGGKGDDDIYSVKLNFNLPEIRKYNRVEIPVEVTLRDRATGSALPSGTALIIREGKEIPAEITSGRPLLLLEGDKIKFESQGYQPETTDLTASALSAGKLDIALNAVPKPATTIVVLAADAGTGEVLNAAVSVDRNGIQTANGSSGNPVEAATGDRLKITAPGYVPVEIAVRQELLDASSVKVAMMGENKSDVKVLVSAIDPKNGNSMPSDITIRRKAGTKTVQYMTSIPAGGIAIGLHQGAEVIFNSPGYEPLTIGVTGTMIKEKSVVGRLKPVQVQQVTSGNSAPSGQAPIVQIKMTSDQKFIIYFDFDRFRVRKDAAEILAKVAYVLLEEYQTAEVLLTGHTDSRGSYQYNEQLSKNRVNTAKRWLVERGVDPKRIRTDYHGELKLAVTCSDPLRHERSTDICLSRAQHQANRRVEIEILNIK